MSGNKRFHDRRRMMKKPCYYCTNSGEAVDYKETNKIRKFFSDRGKILPRRVTNLCSKHQRQVSNAIKISRIAALLPFVSN